MAGPNNPTSRDVALRAGVSQSTVSYVLSGKRSISPDTRQKVIDAIAELDYYPDSGAQALKSGLSRLIGINYPVVDAYRTGQLAFLFAVVNACRVHSYDVLPVLTDESPDELRRVAGTRLCDGLLLFEVRRVDPRAEVVGSLPIPSLFVGFPDNRSGIVCVDNDFELGGRMAIQALAKAGHRRILCLETDAADSRRLGYLRLFNDGMHAVAEELGISIESYFGRGFLDFHQKIGELSAAGVSDLGLMVSSQVAVDGILSSLLVHDLVPGKDVSVISAGAPAEFPPVDGCQVAGVDYRREETMELAVDSLMAVIQGSPDAMKPGEYRLTTPTLITGNTLRG
jgi:DNA-binding LacI/PurR family transcriptional regulator